MGVKPAAVPARPPEQHAGSLRRPSVRPWAAARPSAARSMTAQLREERAAMADAGGMSKGGESNAGGTGVSAEGESAKNDSAGNKSTSAAPVVPLLHALRRFLVVHPRPV